MRIFIGPVEIAGIANGIAQGLRELGLDASVVLSESHTFQYGGTTNSRLFQLWQKVGALRTSTSRDQLFRKSLLLGAHKLLSWFILPRALFSFDAFIFLYGQTITNSLLELWLLRRFGKKIIFIYVGSDSRPPYIDGGSYPGDIEDELPSPAVLAATVRRRKSLIRLHERYANYLVNSPSTAHFHERPYINWFVMGIPRAILDLPSSSSSLPNKTGKVRILHSPSSPTAKGTAGILSALENLRNKGHSFELIKIQGMPNEVVLRELAQCDFVVDQLYADTPMGAFATEAAYFGKPAVIGGYFSSQVGQFVELESMPPSLFVAPEEIELAIERMMVDASFRHDLGKRAQEFVLQRWNPREVAVRYLRLLRDDVPERWWCDPQAVCYLEGGGVPRGRVKRLVASLVRHGGVSALQVSDKPELERAFCELIGSASLERDSAI